MTMHIRDADDLRKYGINILTGEACPLSARLLCDVDESGAAILRDLLGLPEDTEFRRGWNNPNRYSVMIPRDMFESLYVWCLIHAGAEYVLVSTQGDATGFTKEEAEKPVPYWWTGQAVKNELERVLFVWREMSMLRRVYSFIPGQPRVGTRSVHAFSGRTV